MATYEAAKVASSALYQKCFDQYKGDMEEVMLCITNAIEQRYDMLNQDMTSWLLVLAGAMVFIMVREYMHQASLHDKFHVVQVMETFT